MSEKRSNVASKVASNESILKSRLETVLKRMKANDYIIKKDAHNLSRILDGLSKFDHQKYSNLADKAAKITGKFKHSRSTPKGRIDRKSDVDFGLIHVTIFPKKKKEIEVTEAA